MTVRHILMVTNLEIKFIGFIGLGRFLEEKLACERFRYFQSKISVQIVRLRVLHEKNVSKISFLRPRSGSVYDGNFIL